MIQLFTQRDHVFRYRTERFHWHLRMCVEKNKLRAGSVIFRVEDVVTVEYIEGSHTESADLEKEVRNNFTYALNSFVAVWTEKTDCDLKFWIGRINEVKNNNEGIANKIVVHWFQPYTKGDCFHAKYGPYYSDKKGRSRREP